MKRLFRLFGAVILGAVLVFSLTACLFHTHTFSDTYSYSDTHHWHGATCSHYVERAGYEEHTFADGYCTVCGMQDPSVPDVLRYSLNPDGVSYRVSGIGTVTGGDLTVPESFNGKPVTVIGDGAFRGNATLTSVRIPATVESVGEQSFARCTLLRRVTFDAQSACTSIGVSAFSGCARLSEVILPDRLTVISRNAFSDCTSIGHVDLPASLTLLGDAAFSGCTTLGDVKLPDGILTVGKNTFYGDVKLSYVTLPKRCTDIRAYAFSGCTSLSGIEIPDTVEHIGTYAFCDCASMRYVNFGPGSKCERIENFAFKSCRSLCRLTFGAKLGTIGQYSFMECSSLYTVTLPASLRSIGTGAFGACTKLIEVVNLSPLSLALRSKDHGYVAYDAEVIATDPADSRIREADGFVFFLGESGVHLIAYLGTDSSVVLPDSYEGQPYEVYYYALGYRTDLTDVTVPEGVEVIQKAAFMGCASLERLTLPSTLKKIRYAAISACPRLRFIDFSGSSEQWGEVIKETGWDEGISGYGVFFEED